MDLAVYYQTAATISPILLGGTASAFSGRRPDRTYLGRTAFSVLLVVPPFVVTLFSLGVLAGLNSAETWRLPVYLLLGLQLLLGLGGVGNFVFTTKEQREQLARGDRWWRKEKRRRRRAQQPHSQPHKPEPTGPDETARPAPPAPQNRTSPAETEPNVT
jgi:hypothetical protein